MLLTVTGVLAQAGNEVESLRAATLKEKDKARLFELYYKLASVTMPDNIDTSIHYALKARNLAERSGLREQYVKSLLVLSTAYLHSGRLDEFKTSSIEALKISVETGDENLQYYAHRNMGVIFRREANYDSALYHYLTCNRLAEKVNPALLSSSYLEMASFYSTVKDLDKAEECCLKALALGEKYKDTIDIATAYEHLGILNRDKGNYGKALHYYKQAAAIMDAQNDAPGMAHNYNDLGAIYSKMGETDSGSYYLRKSIDIRERMNLLIELPYTYNYLGENYEREGDLVNAELYIKKALNLAIQIKNNKQHYEALESLSDFYARNKKYDSAYAYLQLYKSFRDSIRKLDNDKLIADLNAEYETEKKEKRIQEQQFEITRKNYLLGIGTVLILSVTLLGYSTYRRNKLRQAAALQATILKQQEFATKAVLEAEENERQRIAGDLHDGVGQMMSAAKINLSTVINDISFSSELHKQRFENALKLVDDSCTEVRNVSHNIMPNSLLRNSLAAAVRLFINNIDQHVIKINLHTEGLNEKLDENIETMLYRVVQECVNNVIKHAGADMLDISLVKDSKEISIMIEDNGKGFDITDRKIQEGIGMKNIRSRVTFLKGTVEWDSAPGRGTVVSIHVPV